MTVLGDSGGPNAEGSTKAGVSDAIAAWSNEHQFWIALSEVSVLAATLAGLVKEWWVFTAITVFLTLVFAVLWVAGVLQYVEETVEKRAAEIHGNATDAVTALSTAISELQVTTQAGLSLLPDGPDFTRPIRALVRDILKAQDGGSFPPQERFQSAATFGFEPSSALARELSEATVGSAKEAPPVKWTIIHHRAEFTLKPGRTDNYIPVLAGLLKPKVVMTESAWDAMKPFMSESWDPFFPVWPAFEHQFKRQTRTSSFRRLPWLNPRATEDNVEQIPPSLTVRLYDVNNDQIGDACVIKFEDVLAKQFPNPNGVTNDQRRTFVKSVLDNVASPARAGLPSQLESHIDGILAVSTARTGDTHNLFGSVISAKPDRLEVVQSLDYLLPIGFGVGDDRMTLDRYVFPIDRITQGAQISFILAGKAPIRFDRSRPPSTPPRLDIRPVEIPDDDGVNYSTLQKQTWTIKTEASLWLMPGDSIVTYWDWNADDPPKPSTRHASEAIRD